MGGTPETANVNKAGESGTDVDDAEAAERSPTGDESAAEIEGAGDGDGAPDTEGAAGDGAEARTGPHAEAGSEHRPERVSLLARAWVLVPLYGLVALALTWPLVAHLTDSLSHGTEPAVTVPMFNLWTLEWNRLQIGELYTDYWDAPIFHPTPGAFALSEPQPLTGLAYAPIAWLSGNPVLGYNLVSLLILALNGYAAARLARTLGLLPAPAALVGVLGVGLPFVAHQMGVLQLTVVFPLLLLLEAVLRWAPSGGFWPSVRVGGWLAVTFLTCAYYGLFAVVGLGLVAPVLARRRWLARDRLVDLATAAGALAVLAGPIVLGQASYTSDYDRPDEVIRDLSAASGDYWQLTDDAVGAGIAPWLGERTTGHGLYPGTAMIGLAVAGLLLGGRRRAGRAEEGPAAPVGPQGAEEPAVPATSEGPEAAVPEGSARPAVPATSEEPEAAVPGGWARPAVPATSEGPEKPVVPVVPEGSTPLDEQRRPWFLFAGVCVAWLLSRGLKLSVLGFEPYEVVRSVVPGYEELRSPFRFAALAELFLLGLAAYGLDALWHAGRRVRLGRWRPRVGALVAPVVVALAVAEVSVAPVELLEPEPRAPGWATWLEEHAEPPADGGPSGDRPVVAFAPPPASGRAADYGPTVQRMLHALDADLATVNGYSGLFPETYIELEGAVADYPSEHADGLLEEAGVQYLVATQIWLAQDRGRHPWLVSRYQEVYADGEVSIFQLR
jgi:hypothetical protein